MDVRREDDGQHQRPDPDRQAARPDAPPNSPDKGGGEPVFEATVTSNKGKRVEKVTIRSRETQYFAQRENEPSIYELDGKAVEDLQKAAADVKEAPRNRAKKK